MKRSLLFPVFLVALVALRVHAQPVSSESSDPVIAGLVKVADEIKLPAKEPGVLVQLAVQEGNNVKAGAVIAKIDDSEPQMQLVAAKAAYSGAYNRWKEDIEIRFSKAAALVAKAEYEGLVESTRLAEKAVPESDLRKAKLEWEKSILGGEKSIHDQTLAKFEAYTKQAEWDAAKLAIERRIVKAPFDGIVEEIKRHQEEWVQPGDTILTLMRMDTLHVEGAIEQSKYDPHEIQGCEVAVDVEMARGRKASFKGRIIKVSSIVRSDGVYNVRAEIANQQDNGNWVLRDGMPALMTIRIGTGNAAPAVSRKQ
jgi:membrane fusion protein, multidrug efflux system